MPFPFSYVCDLLDTLHPLHFRDHPLLPKILSIQSIEKTNRWLKIRKNDLNAFNTQSDAALWMLRPDKMGDREYGITAQTLQLIIARIFQLSIEDMKKLQRWETQPHLGDLAVCVQDIRETKLGISTLLRDNVVTVEEIQNTLLQIASREPGSSPAVRSLARHEGVVDRIEFLKRIYTRLDGREAKWLTRFILKDYGAVLLPDSWPCDSGHFGLPNCAPIVMDIFTRDPPVEILDGTRRVKATPEVRAAEHRHRIDTVGWEKRPLRSREVSPISPPVKPYKKTTLSSSVSVTLQEISPQKSFSRHSSPDSSTSLTWEKGILKPNPKRKRSEILSDLVSMSVNTPSKSKVRQTAISSTAPNQNAGLYATPSSIRPPSRNLVPLDLKVANYPKYLTIPISAVPPCTITQSSTSFTTIQRSLARASKPVSGKNLPVFIDLTESPLRSRCPTTPIASGLSKISTSSKTKTRSPNIATTSIPVFCAIKAPTPSSTALSDVSPKRTPTTSTPTQVPSLRSGITNGFATITLEKSFEKAPPPARAVLTDMSSNSALRNQISPHSSDLIPTSIHFPSNPLITAGTGICRLTTSECSLIRCIILLSPSLTKDPRLVNDYLPWHGLQYITNLKALAHPHLPICCPMTKLRYRRLVLVDMHNRTETADFLTGIEDLRLQNRVKRSKLDGKSSTWTADLIEVYDWKVLEAVAKLDHGKRFDYNLWHRHHVTGI